MAARKRALSGSPSRRRAKSRCWRRRRSPAPSRRRCRCAHRACPPCPSARLRAVPLASLKDDLAELQREADEDSDAPPPLNYMAFFKDTPFMNGSKVQEILLNQAERCPEDEAALMELVCPTIACELEVAMVSHGPCTVHPACRRSSSEVCLIR